MVSNSNKTQSKKAKNYDFFLKTSDESYLPSHIEYHQENPTQGLMGFFPNEDVDDPRLTSTEAFCYMRLYSLMQKHGYAWASNKYLSKITRTTERQVRNILRKLRQLNFIKTVGLQVGIREYRRIYVPHKFEQFVRAHQSHPPPNAPPNFSQQVINEAVRNKNLKYNIQRQSISCRGGNGFHGLHGNGLHTYKDTTTNKSISNDIPKNGSKECSQKKDFTKEVMELSAQYCEAANELLLAGKQREANKEAQHFDLLTRKDGAQVSEVSAVIKWLFTKSWYKENGVLPLNAKKFRDKYSEYRQKYLAQQKSSNNLDNTKEINRYEAENRSYAYEIQRKSRQIDVHEKCVMHRETKDSLSYRLNPATFREILMKWAAEEINTSVNNNSNHSHSSYKSLESIKERYNL